MRTTLPNARFPRKLAVASLLSLTLPCLAAAQTVPLSAEKTSPTSNSSETSLLSAAESDIRLGHDDLAIQALRPIVAAHPDLARAHYDLGYALFRIRDGAASLESNLRGSIQEMARCLELDERNADAHKILGLDLTMIQKDDLAGPEFAESARLAPTSPESRYFYGRYLMQHGQYSAAVPELREASRLDPAYIKAFENLGITLDRLGMTDEARSNLQHAADLNARNSSPSEAPYLDLARFDEQHGNPTEGLPFAMEAVHLNPRSEDALLELALLDRSLERWQDAADALERAEVLHPDAAQTQYLLGRTYKALGDNAKSQAAFRRFETLRARQDASVLKRTEADKP